MPRGERQFFGDEEFWKPGDECQDIQQGLRAPPKPEANYLENQELNSYKEYSAAPPHTRNQHNFFKVRGIVNVAGIQETFNFLTVIEITPRTHVDELCGRILDRVEYRFDGKWHATRFERDDAEYYGVLIDDGFVFINYDWWHDMDDEAFANRNAQWMRMRDGLWQKRDDDEDFVIDVIIDVYSVYAWIDETN
ncbi:hypothetical protein AAP_02395 [Ascosphaera apis ARSEF 7405]|uniref:Uncharacterized protein n=1 Tax=Ascosphaera apis ARSEF 7405 TaxID=392613 RepID=A0A162IHQ1_9EURO|nr:hypothetical protein AAP_02395 [Ascosphaera apis ARSEF 7405]